MNCLTKFTALQNICRAFLFDINNTGVSLQILPRNFSATCSRRQDESSDSDTPVAAEKGSESLKPAIDPETSIRYLDSDAYKMAYGDLPVWYHYRRNFKGNRAPRTRKTCIRKGTISTASPCPICRDEYLVIHHKNLKLLNQFLDRQNGFILDSMKTGICQVQHKRLVMAIEKAKDCGLVETFIPFRHYDYSEYYEMLEEKKEN